MNKYQKRLRWTCPHCGGSPMKLKSGQKHLRRKHADCWSCRTERLLLTALRAGMGYLEQVSADPYRRLSRARAEPLSATPTVRGSADGLV